MQRERHTIFGVHITERAKHASQVQDIFTKYGCSIKTRLGLHEVSDAYCSPNGLILLEMLGDQGEIDACLNELQQVEGVETKAMTFDHPV
jgi:hypothetical protein